MQSKNWEVVGGVNTGGLVVREGKELTSEQCLERLSVGAIVEELLISDGRLNYRLQMGKGPLTGWVSIKTPGRVLLVRKKFDPYAILQIQPDATEKAIKSAFRKASLEHHPDRNPGPDAAARFREVTRARDFLLDPLKRFFYNIKHGHRQKLERAQWWLSWDELFEEVEPIFVESSHDDEADAVASKAEVFEDSGGDVQPFASQTEASEVRANGYHAVDRFSGPSLLQLAVIACSALHGSRRCLRPLDVPDCAISLPPGPSLEPALEPDPPAVTLDRPIDILIFGATGLVGMLAVMEVQQFAPGRTWAIAGRDERKLGLLEAKFGKGPLYRGAIHITKDEDIEPAARTARVIVDASGPKMLMGDIVAEACARAGTHVVDCSSWYGDIVHRAVNRESLDKKAKAAGICLVLFCGHMGVAHDFGIWCVVEFLREKFGVPTGKVDSYEFCSGLKLGNSAQQSAAANKELIEAEKRLGEFMLGGERPGGMRTEDITEAKIKYDHHFGVWMVSAFHSERSIPRCTCGLMDAHYQYGANFSYKLNFIFDDDVNAQICVAHTKALPKRGVQMYVEEGRFPPPGSGPKERVRAEAVSTRIFVAEADEVGPERRRAHCVVKLGPGGRGDPHQGTAEASIQAACCILDALDGGRASELRYGFGTPVYHLAHLGFKGHLERRGWFFDLRNGDIPPDLLKYHVGLCRAAIA
mmetsp:Transcript_81079/g.173353  ORF Transcript_81079/g.173353 Transcript_81079/m.173353 type:complete len:699 (+) Transcript_81079:89-2185(+)